ncbi:MAG: hypothetical protein WC738_04105 [Candidatus Omnitrophota bacterium]|jgi:hypothetical protein
MNKFLKAGIVVIIATALLILLYRLVFIRTVDYEIAGIKIPCKYSILTGSVKPISDYKGNRKLKTVETTKSNKLGLSEEQVVIAKLRWAIFEQWADSRAEYKGWRDNPAVFKKANDNFKQLIKNNRQ